MEWNESFTRRLEHKTAWGEGFTEEEVSRQSTTAVIDDSINPLHPAILKAYKGVVVDEPTSSTGTDHTDIEFPSMKHAAMWADVCEVSGRVSIRDTEDDPEEFVFDRPIVVQLRWWSSTSKGVSLVKPCIGCNGAEIMNGHRRECPDYVYEGSRYSV